MTDTRLCLGANRAILGWFSVVRRFRNHGRHFYRTRCGQKCRICRWNFDAICHSSRYISTSGLSECYFRLSVVVAITFRHFFELSVVVGLYHIFAVGISRLSVIVPAISGFLGYFRLTMVALEHLLLFYFYELENPCRWNFGRYLSYTFWRHKYFRFVWPYYYFRLSLVVEINVFEPAVAVSPRLTIEKRHTFLFAI